MLNEMAVLFSLSFSSFRDITFRQKNTKNSSAKTNIYALMRLQHFLIVLLSRTWISRKLCFNHYYTYLWLIFFKLFCYYLMHYFPSKNNIVVPAWYWFKKGSKNLICICSIECAPNVIHSVEDPGSGTFVTPGSGMVKKSGPDPEWTTRILFPRA